MAQTNFSRNALANTLEIGTSFYIKTKLSYYIQREKKTHTRLHHATLIRGSI